jgi:hypothetical protein
MIVGEVGTGGLRVRYAPNGTVMGRIAEGKSIIILDGPVIIEDVIWYRVISMPERLEGWVVGEYLIADTTN